MHIDEAARTFLALDRIAVVGVSRGGTSPANAIATKLRETGHEVFAVNRSGVEVGGHPTFPAVDAIDGGVDAVVVVTRPEHARAAAEEAGRAGARWIWFHQGFGPVSYDDEAIRTAREAGLHVIAAACPMMYADPDGFHRCALRLFRWVGRVPGDIPLSTPLSEAETTAPSR